MGTPVYLLAGQSNAIAMRGEIRRSLDERHGADGYVLVEAAASGAPLTYKRSGEDWAASNELRQQMLDDTIAALLAVPDGQVSGMIWIQGEGDTHTVARAGEYAARLDALIGGLRGGVTETLGPRDTGIGTAPVALCRLSEHAEGGNTRGHWDDVIAQQTAFGAAQELAVLVRPDDVAAQNGIASGEMFSDGLHYGAGLRPHLADALVAALQGFDGGSSSGKAPGTDGDDVLRGTAGGDVLAGGKGNDTYFADHAGDRLREAAGEGSDLVIASRDFTLRFHSQNLENLTLAEGGDFNATGNGRGNVISGNSGANILKGAWGDDILFGGAGNDTFIDAHGHNRMIGGTGDDTYRITHKGNRIVEQAGDGHDRVSSSVSLTLRFHSQHIEDLTLTGSRGIHATGNGLANVLRGNAGNNALDGAWGGDWLDGGAGDDVLTGHVGDDTLLGGGGRDIFVFAPGQGQDTILDFEAGQDRLRFDAIAPGSLEIAQAGGDTQISWGAGTGVTLEGVAAADLSDAGFLFF